jgi:hypothetical protein
MKNQAPAMNHSFPLRASLLQPSAAGHYHQRKLYLVSEFLHTDCKWAPETAVLHPLRNIKSLKQQFFDPETFKQISDTILNFQHMH